MFHLAANFVAIANVANTEVPALQDDVLPIKSGRHTPSQNLNLVMAYSSAVTLLRTRLNTPYARRITPSFIVPIGITLLPPTDPNFADYRDGPFLCRRDEGILYESTDSAAGPNNHYIISWLTPGLEQIPAGPIWTLRGSSTTAAVASTWTSVTVTWDADISEGIYAVVGGAYFATNAVAFQCIFENQYFRPGGLGGASAGIRPPWPQLKGGLGVWGRFRSLNPPLMRVLNDGADNAHVFHLDVVRMGDLPPDR